MNDPAIRDMTSDLLSDPSRLRSAPAMSADALAALGRQILSYSTVDTTRVELVHTVQGITRVMRNRMRAGEDGETLTIRITTQHGSRTDFELGTNQISAPLLRAAVQLADAQARSASQGSPDKEPLLGPRTYVPVTLTHPSTLEALHEGRHAVAPALVRAVRAAHLQCSVFVGVMNRSTCAMDTSGLLASGEETDAEVTLTVWTRDGMNSGWAGQATRDWSQLAVSRLAEEAIDMARRSENPVALEPGRRTAILGPAAVGQLLRNVPMDIGHEGPGAIGRRVCDARLTLQSDPADAEGGYLPFFPIRSNRGEIGYPVQAMVWIRNGIQENHALVPGRAAQLGRLHPHPGPMAMRVSGSTITSVADMIAGCQEGVYIHRLYGGAEGVTRDGCFLIKHGKLERPVKNFRIRENPWFALNNLEAIGPTARTAWGANGAWFYDQPWPHEPVIVPPLMIRDFNLVALADAM
jgi:predicted Zn-dependent protease